MTSMTRTTAPRARWPGQTNRVRHLNGASQPARALEPRMIAPFKPGQNIDAYLERMSQASTSQLIELERRGVPHAFVAALSQRMAVPLPRMQELMRISRATAARKRSDENSLIGGAAGTAATAIVKLMGMAQRIVNQSTSPEARGFDVRKWFGAWIDLPQPALDGKKPADLLDTPSGIEAVARVLGALESGAYQ